MTSTALVPVTSPRTLVATLVPPPGFDYSGMGEVDVDDLRRVRDDISSRVSRINSDIFAIGDLLRRAREKLDRQFNAWVTAELPFSRSTAYNYMNAAENIPVNARPTVGRLPPTTVYALAAPNTPHDARTEIITGLRSEALKPEEVVDVVRRARKVAEEERVRAKGKPITPELRSQWAKNDKRRNDRLALEREKFRQEQEADRIATSQKVEEVADEIRSKFSKEQIEFIRQVLNLKSGVLNQLPLRLAAERGKAAA